MASKRRAPIATLREPLGAGAKKRRSPRRVVLGRCDIAGRQADARDVGDALSRLVNGISDRKFTPDGETCPIAHTEKGRADPRRRQRIPAPDMDDRPILIHDCATLDHAVDHRHVTSGMSDFFAE
ncbi:MAG: hypothetical protein ACLPSW_11890 [Roseiarcus sp.]